MYFIKLSAYFIVCLIDKIDINIVFIQHLQYNIDSDQRGKLETLKTISTSRECFRDYWNMRWGGIYAYLDYS